MADLDFDWMYEKVDEFYEKQDIMIRASNKAGLTRNELIDMFFEQGIMAIYYLGMEHMYEYLKE